MAAQVPQGAQEYLEAIFEMEEEGGRIPQARIAKRLGVSAPAVSEQVRRLVRADLVTVEDRDISLTEHGREVALSVQDRILRQLSHADRARLISLLEAVEQASSD